MSPERVLEARGLEVRYGSVQAVKGVDLHVDRGEVVGLIGPDGAGKTSSLRVLAGLMRASGGAAAAFGSPTWATRRRLHHRLGYLAQRFALYGDLTVDENVQFFSLLYGVVSWRDKRDRLLRRVGLEEFRDRLADRLSGGMKQKLALACTLIHSPEVLLLDEPTTGVDPVTRREFWRFLGELVAEGLTLLVATPYLDEAERCSRVVLMHRGSVLADDTPFAVRALLPGTIVEVSTAARSAAAAALRVVAEVADLTAFGDRLHARLETGGDPMAAIRDALESNDVPYDSIRTIPPSLEDTFLYLTRGRGDDMDEEAA